MALPRRTQPTHLPSTGLPHWRPSVGWVLQTCPRIRRMGIGSPASSAACGVKGGDGPRQRTVQPALACLVAQRPDLGISSSIGSIPPDIVSDAWRWLTACPRRWAVATVGSPHVRRERYRRAARPTLVHRLGNDRADRRRWDVRIPRRLRVVRRDHVSGPVIFSEQLRGRAWVARRRRRHHGRLGRAGDLQRQGVRPAVH